MSQDLHQRQLVQRDLELLFLGEELKTTIRDPHKAHKRGELNESGVVPSDPLVEGVTGVSMQVELTRLRESSPGTMDALVKKGRDTVTLFSRFNSTATEIIERMVRRWLRGQPHYQYNPDHLADVPTNIATITSTTNTSSSITAIRTIPSYFCSKDINVWVLDGAGHKTHDHTQHPFGRHTAGGARKVAIREVEARCDIMSQLPLERLVQIPLCAVIEYAGFTFFAEADLGLHKNHFNEQVVSPATLASGKSATSSLGGSRSSSSNRLLNVGTGAVHLAGIVGDFPNQQFEELASTDSATMAGRVPEFLTRTVGTASNLRSNARGAVSGACMPVECRVDAAADGTLFISRVGRLRPPLLEPPPPEEATSTLSSTSESSSAARLSAVTLASQKRNAASRILQCLSPELRSSSQSSDATAASSLIYTSTLSNLIPHQPITDNTMIVNNPATICLSAARPLPWSLSGLATRMRERSEFRLLPQLMREHCWGTGVIADSWAGDSKRGIDAADAEVLGLNVIIHDVAIPRLVGFLLLLDECVMGFPVTEDDVAHHLGYPIDDVMTNGQSSLNGLAALSGEESVSLMSDHQEHYHPRSTQEEVVDMYKYLIRCAFGGRAFVLPPVDDDINQIGGPLADSTLPSNTFDCIDVKSVFHYFGVNLRFLGSVVAQLEAQLQHWDAARVVAATTSSTTTTSSSLNQHIISASSIRDNAPTIPQRMPLIEKRVALQTTQNYQAQTSAAKPDLLAMSTRVGSITSAQPSSDTMPTQRDSVRATTTLNSFSSQSAEVNSGVGSTPVATILPRRSLIGQVPLLFTLKEAHLLTLQHDHNKKSKTTTPEAADAATSFITNRAIAAFYNRHPVLKTIRSEMAARACRELVQDMWKRLTIQEVGDRFIDSAKNKDQYRPVGGGMNNSGDTDDGDALSFINNLPPAGTTTTAPQGIRKQPAPTKTVSSLVNEATIHLLVRISGDMMSEANGADEELWRTCIIPMMYHKYGYQWSFFREVRSTSLSGGTRDSNKNILSTGSRVRVRKACSDVENKRQEWSRANNCPAPRPRMLCDMSVEGGGGQAGAWGAAGSSIMKFNATVVTGRVSSTLARSSGGVTCIGAPSNSSSKLILGGSSHNNSNTTSASGSSSTAPWKTSIDVSSHAANRLRSVNNANRSSTVVHRDDSMLTNESASPSPSARMGYAPNFTSLTGGYASSLVFDTLEFLEGVHNGYFSIAGRDRERRANNLEWALDNTSPNGTPAPIMAIRANHDDDDTTIRLGEKQDYRIVLRMCQMCGMHLFHDSGGRSKGRSLAGISIEVQSVVKGLRASLPLGPSVIHASLAGKHPDVILAQQSFISTMRKAWGSSNLADMKVVPHLYTLAESYRMHGSHSASVDILKKVRDMYTRDSNHNELGILMVDLQLSKTLAAIQNFSAAQQFGQRAVNAATEMAGTIASISGNGVRTKGSSEPRTRLLLISLLSLLDVFDTMDDGGHALNQRKLDLMMRLRPLCMGTSSSSRESQGDGIAIAKVEGRAAVFKLGHSIGELRRKLRENAGFRREIRLIQERHNLEIEDEYKRNHEINLENEKANRYAAITRLVMGTTRAGASPVTAPLNSGGGVGSFVGEFGNSTTSDPSVANVKKRDLTPLEKLQDRHRRELRDLAPIHNIDDAKQEISDAEETLLEAITNILRLQYGAVDDELIYFVVKYVHHSRRLEVLPVVVSAVFTFIHASSPYFNPAIDMLVDVLFDNVRRRLNDPINFKDVSSSRIPSMFGPGVSSSPFDESTNTTPQKKVSSSSQFVDNLIHTIANPADGTPTGQQAVLRSLVEKIKPFWANKHLSKSLSKHGSNLRKDNASAMWGSMQNLRSAGIGASISPTHARTNNPFANRVVGSVAPRGIHMTGSEDPDFGVVIQPSVTFKQMGGVDNGEEDSSDGVSSLGNGEILLMGSPMPSTDQKRPPSNLKRRTRKVILDMDDGNEYSAPNLARASLYTNVSSQSAMEIGNSQIISGGVPVSLHEEIITASCHHLFSLWLNQIVSTIPHDRDILKRPWLWGRKVTVQPYCLLVSRVMELCSIRPILGFQICTMLSDYLHHQNKLIPTEFALLHDNGGDRCSDTSAASPATSVLCKAVTSMLGLAENKLPLNWNPKTSAASANSGGTASKSSSRGGGASSSASSKGASEQQTSPTSFAAILALPFVMKIAQMMWGAFDLEMRSNGHTTPPVYSMYNEEIDPKRAPQFSHFKQMNAVFEAISGCLQCLGMVYRLPVAEFIDGQLSMQTSPSGGGQSGGTASEDTTSEETNRKMGTIPHSVRQAYLRKIRLLSLACNANGGGSPVPASRGGVAASGRGTNTSQGSSSSKARDTKTPSLSTPSKRSGVLQQSFRPQGDKDGNNIGSAGSLYALDLLGSSSSSSEQSGGEDADKPATVTSPASQSPSQMAASASVRKNFGASFSSNRKKCGLVGTISRSHYFADGHGGMRLKKAARYDIAQDSSFIPLDITWVSPSLCEVMKAVFLGLKIDDVKDHMTEGILSTVCPGGTPPPQVSAVATKTEAIPPRRLPSWETAVYGQIRSASHELATIVRTSQNSGMGGAASGGTMFEVLNRRSASDKLEYNDGLGMSLVNLFSLLPSKLASAVKIQHEMTMNFHSSPFADAIRTPSNRRGLPPLSTSDDFQTPANRSSGGPLSPSNALHGLVVPSLDQRLQMVLLDLTSRSLDNASLQPSSYSTASYDDDNPLFQSWIDLQQEVVQVVFSGRIRGGNGGIGAFQSVEMQMCRVPLIEGDTALVLPDPLEGAMDGGGVVGQRGGNANSRTVTSDLPPIRNSPAVGAGLQQHQQLPPITTLNPTATSTPAHRRVSFTSSSSPSPIPKQQPFASPPRGQHTAASQHTPITTLTYDRPLVAVLPSALVLAFQYPLERVIFELFESILSKFPPLLMRIGAHYPLQRRELWERYICFLQEFIEAQDSLYIPRYNKFHGNRKVGQLLTLVASVHAVCTYSRTELGAISGIAKSEARLADLRGRLLAPAGSTLEDGRRPARYTDMDMIHCQSQFLPQPLRGTVLGTVILQARADFHFRGKRGSNAYVSVFRPTDYATVGDSVMLGNGGRNSSVGNFERSVGLASHKKIALSESEWSSGGRDEDLSTASMGQDASSRTTTVAKIVYSRHIQQSPYDDLPLEVCFAAATHTMQAQMANVKAGGAAADEEGLIASYQDIDHPIILQAVLGNDIDLLEDLEVDGDKYDDTTRLRASLAVPASAILGSSVMGLGKTTLMAGSARRPLKPTPTKMGKGKKHDM